MRKFRGKPLMQTGKKLYPGLPVGRDPQRCCCFLNAHSTKETHSTIRIFPIINARNVRETSNGEKNFFSLRRESG